MRENQRTPILVRLLGAVVYGYAGYQMLGRVNPFLSGPRLGGIGLLILAGYCLYRAWKVWSDKGTGTQPLWRRKPKGAVEEALERYDDLQRLDPGARESATQELFATLEKQLQEEISSLRVAARTDPEAARALRDRLQKQIASSTAMVREYKQHLRDEPGLSKFVDEVDQKNAATRLELADLETKIKLLSHKG